MQCVDLGGRRIIKKPSTRDGRPTLRVIHSAPPDFFQAEDGIRDVERSRGLGDVYKRQGHLSHSGDLLLWVGVRRSVSCVNIFFSRTTGPILIKFDM